MRRKKSKGRIQKKDLQLLAAFLLDGEYELADLPDRTHDLIRWAKDNHRTTDLGAKGFTQLSFGTWLIVVTLFAAALIIVWSKIFDFLNL